MGVGPLVGDDGGTLAQLAANTSNTVAITSLMGIFGEQCYSA
jgi:hypothetical protein